MFASFQPCSTGASARAQSALRAPLRKGARGRCRRRPGEDLGVGVQEDARPIPAHGNPAAETLAFLRLKRRAASHSTSWVPSPSSSKSTVMRQSSATPNSYQTPRRSLGDLLRRGGTRVRLRADALGGGGGDERSSPSGTPSSRSRPRPARRASSSPRGGARSADRLPEARDLRRGDRLVEAQGGQAGTRHCRSVRRRSGRRGPAPLRA